MPEFKLLPIVVFPRAKVYHKRRSFGRTVCGRSITHPHNRLMIVVLTLPAPPYGKTLCRGCHLVGVYARERAAIAEAQKEG